MEMRVLSGLQNLHIARFPQDFHADDTSTAPDQEICCSIENGQILDPHFLQIFWQSRIRKLNLALCRADANSHACLQQKVHGSSRPRLRRTRYRIQSWAARIQAPMETTE